MVASIRSCSQFDQIFLSVLDKHAPLKRKLLRVNHSSYISKPLWKSIWEAPNLKRFITKTNRKKALKHIRNRKTFAADCIKKKANDFSIILIHLLLLTINYSRKQLNHSFQTSKITDHKLNSLKKMRSCKTMIWLRRN